MANQAFSRSDDLMVGAGVLYFQRNDDPHGWHHMGNAEEFTINNNIETIEKNSSMNKKRELMASVVTSVQPTGSITLNEYNPFNVALGLYGTEGVLHQAGRTLTSEAYAVTSVPGVITVVDADGNRCMDISNVVLTPSVTTPASVKFTAPAGQISQTTTADDTYTDTGGGKVVISGIPSGLTTTTNIYVGIDGSGATVTSGGDLDGVVAHIRVGLAGTQVDHTFSTGVSEPVVVDGITFTFSVTGTDSFTTTDSSAIGSIEAVFTPATANLVEGKDYVADAQELRAGVIKIKSGGAISEGDTVLVSCTVPEKDFITVSGANAGEIEGKLLFIGDPNIGGQYNIEAWKVKVTPDGDFTGLIGDDFGTFTLTVRFLSDYENHPEYPYYQATMIGRSSGGDKVSGTYDPEY